MVEANTAGENKMIKFMKHYVTNGADKARVWYSLDNHVSQQPCVTIYAKDYGHALGRVIEDGYQNDTDSMTDYFDKGRVRLFHGHPLYAAARARAEQNAAEWDAKRAA